MTKTLAFKQFVLNTPETKKRSYKVNWLTDKELITFGIVDDKQLFVNPTEVFLDGLYTKVREFLTSQDFVFGDYKGCRVKLNKAGRLIEYGMEFKHIK